MNQTIKKRLQAAGWKVGGTREFLGLSDEENEIVDLKIRLAEEGAETMAVQVNWDSKVCIHSTNCVKTLPQVFKVEQGKFVIEPSAAADEKVIAAVKACPSGALKIRS